jgi:hypothetical protein
MSVINIKKKTWLPPHGRSIRSFDITYVLSRVKMQKKIGCCNIPHITIPPKCETKKKTFTMLSPPKFFFQGDHKLRIFSGCKNCYWSVLPIKIYACMKIWLIECNWTHLCINKMINVVSFPILCIPRSSLFSDQLIYHIYPTKTWWWDYLATYMICTNV